MTIQVGILMGSQSDWDIMSHTAATLHKLKVTNEARVLSAHRSPHAVVEYCEAARDNGIKVIIAGAGLAAGLPGMIAGLTPLPVLGVPMYSKYFGGMDAMLSMVQMPGGVPVGTLAIGKAGAVNAGVLAASILALSDDTIRDALDEFRAKQTQTILDMPPLQQP